MDLAHHADGQAIGPRLRRGADARVRFQFNPLNTHIASHRRPRRSRVAEELNRLLACVCDNRQPRARTPCPDTVGPGWTPRVFGHGVETDDEAAWRHDGSFTQGYSEGRVDRRGRMGRGATAGGGEARYNCEREKSHGWMPGTGAHHSMRARERTHAHFGRSDQSIVPAGSAGRVSRALTSTGRCRRVRSRRFITISAPTTTNTTVQTTWLWLRLPRRSPGP